VKTACPDRLAAMSLFRCRNHKFRIGALLNKINMKNKGIINYTFISFYLIPNHELVSPYQEVYT
jgi:hypothetical protein